MDVNNLDEDADPPPGDKLSTAINVLQGLVQPPV